MDKLGESCLWCLHVFISWHGENGKSVEVGVGGDGKGLEADKLWCRSERKRERERERERERML